MKKIFCLLPVFITLMFTSCFDEKENWYTNTKDYDGRYSVAVTCEEYSDDDLDIEDGNELWIYNSSANVDNQIIIDTHIAGLHIRGKFDVVGSPASFNATGGSTPNVVSSLLINNDEFYVVDDDGDPIAYPSSLPVPAGLGEEWGGVQFYSRISLENGKITPQGATTIGGNISDKIYMEITLYFEYLVFESYQIDEKDWAVPGVPEFDWRIKEGSRTNADGWEEHWTLEGYRYTGYPEDF